MVDTTLQPAFESSKENPKIFEPIIRMIILIPILVFSFTDMHTYWDSAEILIPLKYFLFTCLRLNPTMTNLISRLKARAL